MKSDRAAQPALADSSDRRLVRACLDGDDRAWEALVERYQGLVYSLALRKGLAAEDAADLFQAVWVQAYLKLSSLRDLGSIRSWLISVTVNACYHSNRRRRQLALRETSDLTPADLTSHPPTQPVNLAEAEAQLEVQRAIASLPPRCQELIRLLFYTQPPVPYREVAERLGLAVGSIGFIRGRCLEKLQRLLDAPHGG